MNPSFVPINAPSPSRAYAARPCALPALFDERGTARSERRDDGSGPDDDSERGTVLPSERELIRETAISDESLIGDRLLRNIIELVQQPRGSSSERAALFETQRAMHDLAAVLGRDDSSVVVLPEEEEVRCEPDLRGSGRNSVGSSSTNTSECDGDTDICDEGRRTFTLRHSIVDDLIGVIRPSDNLDCDDPNETADRSGLDPWNHISSSVAKTLNRSVNDAIRLVLEERFDWQDQVLSFFDGVRDETREETPRSASRFSSEFVTGFDDVDELADVDVKSV